MCSYVSSKLEQKPVAPSFDHDGEPAGTIDDRNFSCSWATVRTVRTVGFSTTEVHGVLLTCYSLAKFSAFSAASAVLEPRAGKAKREWPTAASAVVSRSRLVVTLRTSQIYVCLYICIFLFICVGVFFVIAKNVCYLAFIYTTSSVTN